jgi:hypothetical protein
MRFVYLNSEIPVDAVGCANGAVLLMGLRGSLKIGEVGSMDPTVQIMASADKVIHPR